MGSAAQPTFTKAEGMAVVQSSGDLLVIDASARTLSRYHADGSADNFSALGVNVIDGVGSGPPCSPPSVQCDGTPQGSILGIFRDADEVQVAVDESGGATNGDIYLTDCSHHLIDIFASSGEYLGQLTAAGVTGFGETCGVAVDSSGAVYVSDIVNPSSGDGKVHKFVSQGAPHNPLLNTDNTANFATAPTLPKPCTIAVGAGPTAGFLFVTQYRGTGGVYKFDASSGEFKYEVSSGISRTVSVDPVSGHILIARGSEALEFDASGASSATEAATPIEPGSAVEGLAANGGSELAYLSRAGDANVEVYGPPVTVPGVTTGPATNVKGSAATLNGTVNPHGVALTECFFEYGRTTTYGKTAPCQAPDAAEVGTGTVPVAVHADIAGLEVGVTYHYRLIAANTEGPGEGLDQSFQTLGPALIDQWVASATATEVELKAKIDPEGKATTFHIEYGLTASYGSSSTEQSAGSGNVPQTFTADIDGLAPGTTYHWRVVATNVDAVNRGPDRTFATYRLPSVDASCENHDLRTGPAANLPDCRAYEMVSPPDKGGGDIVAKPGQGFNREAAFRQAALNGDSITYTSATAFGDAVRGTIANQYLSTRGAGGWSTHGLNPPQGMTVFDPAFDIGYDLSNNFFAFTEGLCQALIRDDNLVPLSADAIHGFTDLYQRRNCVPGADGYEALTRGEPPAFSTGPENLALNYASYSGDLRHVVFGAGATLESTPPPAAGPNQQLYEYDLATDALHLVSVLPVGEGGGAAAGNSALGSAYASIVHGRESPLKGAVSTDGSRIFWTNGGSGGGKGKLYVRVDNTTTLPLSSNGTFLTAAADGSVAIFRQGDELFEFDVDKALAGEPGATTLIAGGLAGEAVGVVGASGNLSRLYFTSKEDLDLGGEAKAGELNLYLREGGAVRFIAALSPQDGGKSTGAEIDSASPLHHSSRVSPDGRYLAFMSTRPLTGYDNTDAVTGEAASEVFRYDATTGQLSCASCRPSGARPVGRKLASVYSLEPGGGESIQTAAWLPTCEWANHCKRSLADDGSRIFFNSYDALLPQDTNGAQDVYEWEALGAGGSHGCTTTAPGYSAANNGCLSLISTGQSPEKSELLDASADGHDVFFTTASSIDPRDRGSIDVYDARVDGGFPPPPPEPPACVGDACQAVPTPPGEPNLSSSSFVGPPNPKPKLSCAKNKRKVRQGGKTRCVAKHKRHRAANHNRRAPR